jgi:hypothetical protein
MRDAPTAKNSDGEPVELHGGELRDLQRDVGEQFVAACERTVDMVGRSRTAHRERAGQMAVGARRRNRGRDAVTVFGVHLIGVEMTVPIGHSEVDCNVAAGADVVRGAGITYRRSPVVSVGEAPIRVRMHDQIVWLAASEHLCSFDPVARGRRPGFPARAL